MGRLITIEGLDGAGKTTLASGLVQELRSRGVSFRSEGPVEMTGGPNAGGKSLYSLDPDGYIFEFHQRPPR